MLKQNQRTTTIKKLWSDGSHICIHWVEQKSWYCFLSLLWLLCSGVDFLTCICFFTDGASFFSRLLGVVIARNGRITHPQTPIQPHLLHLIKTNYCLHTMLYISSLRRFIVCLEFIMRVMFQLPSCRLKYGLICELIHSFRSFSLAHSIELQFSISFLWFYLEIV